MIDQLFEREIARVAEISDPRVRAEQIRVLLDSVNEFRSDLISMRRDAVLDMRATGMSHSQVASAIGTSRPTAVQVARGRSGTRGVADACG